VLGGGELASLDLRVPARAAEEVVDDCEHELRVEHDERSTAQRVDLHEVQVRRHVQRVNVLAELLDLHGAHPDLRRPPQQL